MWLTDHIKNPRFRALVIRKNSDDLSDWIDRAYQLYKGLGAKITSKPAIITFPSGAIIRTGHLKDDQAYTKYQGHEYQRMLIEELTQISQEKRYLQLISSCRSTVPGIKAQVFTTANPGGTGHGWTKKRFIDVAPARTLYIDPETNRYRIFIPATIDDNPVLMQADPEYVGTLEGLKSTDEQLYKAWRWGSWDVFIGQAFSEFMQQIHVTDRFDFQLDMCKKVIGFDWGFNHAGSAQWVTISPENKYGVSRLFSYRELHRNKTTPEEWAKLIAIFTSKEKTEWIVLPHDCYADREGKDSIAKIFKRIIEPTGCKVIRGDTLSQGARVNRVALTHQNLSVAIDGRPYWQIHPKCTSLIETIPTMIYSESNPEDIQKVDGDDDYDSVSLAFKTIARFWNINSGAVRLKHAKTQSKPFHWTKDGQTHPNKDLLEEITKNRPKGTPWKA